MTKLDLKSLDDQADLSAPLDNSSGYAVKGFEAGETALNGLGSGSEYGEVR